MSTDKLSCSTWEKERSINYVRTVKKLSRREIIKTYFSESQNRFDLLATEDSEFPKLSGPQENVKNRDANVNKKLTRVKYSTVARKISPSKKTPVQQVTSREIRVTAPRVSVLDRPEYLKGRVTEMEELITELFSIIQKACAGEHFDEVLGEVRNIKKKFDKCLI